MRFKQYINEKTKILKIYKNKDLGFEAHVAKVEKGFSVVIKDTDAGEFLDSAKIFPDEKSAHKEAKKIQRGF